MVNGRWRPPFQLSLTGVDIYCQTYCLSTKHREVAEALLLLPTPLVSPHRVGRRALSTLNASTEQYNIPADRICRSTPRDINLAGRFPISYCWLSRRQFRKYIPRNSGSGTLPGYKFMRGFSPAPSLPWLGKSTLGSCARAIQFCSLHGRNTPSVSQIGYAIRNPPSSSPAPIGHA